MKHTIGGICGLVLATQLVGCGGLYYSAKPSAPQAALRLENKSEHGPVQMLVYDNPLCHGGKPIGYDGVPKGQSKDLAIEADGPFTFAVAGDRGTKVNATNGTISSIDVRNCQTFSRFTTRPGASYKVSFADNGKACAITVYEVSGQSERAIPFERLTYGRQSEKDLRLSCAPAKG